MNQNCYGKVLFEKDNRKLINCRVCGYKHVFPMYSEEELTPYYENVYAESTPSHLWREKVYNISKWKSEGKILDIGCWEGIQLEHFLKKGWDCCGTELNKRAALVAKKKGIKVKQVSLKEFFSKAAKKKWDVINAAYILEHISNPLDFLKRVKKYMKKSGILIVEVPNEFNPLQLAYIKKHNLRPYWIALPDHLNYFNKQELVRLLDKAGFKIIHGESSYPMEFFLLKGDNYLKDRELGKKSFSKVLRMENALRQCDESLVSQIYSNLYKSGIGRSLIVYATLKNR